MRDFFCFWWRCVRIGAHGSSAFANDWQWLLGIPALLVAALYLASHWGVTNLSTGLPILDGVITAFGAFVITWVVAFTGRTLNAAVTLFHAEKDRADALESRLTNSLDPLAREREEFVDRAFLGLGEIEIEWLQRMTVSGRPTAIPDTVWTVLDRAGLVDRDFSGPKGIKDELKAAVRQRLAEHQSLTGALEIIVSPGS
jgi:hypothetical protein